MIFHLTYLSDGLKVKGYLSVPGGYRINTTMLQEWMGRFNGSVKLPVTEVASSLLPDRGDIRLHKFPALIYCRGGIGKVGRVKASSSSLPPIGATRADGEGMNLADAKMRTYYPRTAYWLLCPLSIPNRLR
jgi:hypothetical protein